MLLQVEGYMYVNAQNRMRMRMYNCFNDIKLHHRFAPVVVPPSASADLKPHVVRAGAPASKGNMAA